MLHHISSRLFALAAVLLIAGCSVPAAQITPPPTQTAVEPAVAPTSVPAPVESAEPVTVEDPGVFVDPADFKTALLQALMEQDTEQLMAWMTEPFLTGGWRADASDTSPADALADLYSYDLGTENRLEWVRDADLIALMGGNDPLSFPRAEAGVIEAALVRGWGNDGRDEAILFIAREADNSLKWHGWILVKGGFSGARSGGVQPYANEEYGYSFFLPNGTEVLETETGGVWFMAPGDGHPGEGRAAALIEVVAASGRTVQEITEQIKADLGPGFNIPPGTAMGLDKAMAIVLSELPGVDPNRQLFVVYNDLLYHVTFVPDAPQVGATYWQMEDLYAQIVNSFHFTN